MKRCLIADNNEFYLEFFSDILSSFDYIVDKACDGLIALNMAREQKYDLFVLDYIMPKVDGIRLAKYIKSIPHYSTTPIILITAAALESIKTDDMENYADVFIAKGPFEKMKDIFGELLPDIEKIAFNKEKKILGLTDIYPRQIVKELLRTELNHSAIFKNLIEGIVQIDEDGKILFVNDSFCENMRLLEELIVGKNIEEIFSSNEYPYVANILKRFKNEKAPVKESTVINYGTKTFHVSFYNLLNEDNLFAGAFLILQDVTEIRNKINEVTAIFNITQAFLSNLHYSKVLEYVIYELRRLVKATDITLILSCEGIFNGEVIQSKDRKLANNEIKKIEYWVEKIINWKKTGLISVKNINKLNKLKFEDLSTLWQPLIFQKIYLGTLLGFKHSGSDFEEEETRFFEAVGNQIAVYLSNIEFLNRQENPDKKEIKRLAQNVDNDIFEKNQFLKWEERQKKKIIQRICENLSNNLSLLDGYLDYLDKDSNITDNEKNKSCYEKISLVENRLKLLRDEFCIINRIGGEEESNMQIFEVGDIFKKIKDTLPQDILKINSEIPSFQKWGDFDKIAFVLKKIIEELLNSGAINFGLEAQEEENRLIVNIACFLDRIKPSLNETFKLINDDKWNDYDDTLYYLLYNLKTFLNIMNSMLKVNLDGNNFEIKIIFQI
ncbi:MAG: response regulator [Proteobacteria bacterium]|nr:response regulator [Pseudomonadota bacterium]